ncbi:MAG: hypothetical protein RL497_426 [Pseudomonadota bacterium]
MGLIKASDEVQLNLVGKLHVIGDGSPLELLEDELLLELDELLLDDDELVLEEELLLEELDEELDESSAGVVAAQPIKNKLLDNSKPFASAPR